MNDQIIKVADFDVDPIPRLRREGPKSGQEFCEDVLIPAFEYAVEHGVWLVVDLDGTYGVPPSFREEIFGGLVRHHLANQEYYDYESILRVKADDRPGLAELAWQDIHKALNR